MSGSTVNVDITKPLPPKKKVTWSNVAVGAAVSLFEVTTLGQPFEVLKTQMAANRGQSLRQAYANVVAKRGISGLWFGLSAYRQPNALTSQYPGRGSRVQELVLPSSSRPLRSSRSRSLLALEMAQPVFSAASEAAWLRPTSSWASARA